ncbi:retrovirus-related pol polyprotein from transposon TNT 1-94 [Tanacetum coccineum]|uniref:Retrovirus-related pol polyprotein from transposon TNT 1-94 n=1 Tax=Tanacetum coccineum TaxID=301880 RepID=A0ABQ5A181_9ASTR
MATMAENVIAVGAENRPSMLEKGMYDSWKTRIWLYIKGKENGEMLIYSTEKGPFQLKKEITISGIDDAPDEKPTIQNGQVTVQNVQRRQSQGYAVNNGKSQAIRTRVINTVREANANQPRSIRCYNCRGEGHMAKQCTAKKRVKDFEWFKVKMLLAQAQEAGVILHKDQKDFLDNRLEEMEDCNDLQLQITSNFKADHVDAYDSDCDDEATSCAIFMASLSPAGSLSGDIVAPTYDSDILFETEYTEHSVFNNDSYYELTSNNNVISYADYIVTIENDVAQYVPPPEQDNAMILSIIEQMKCQVEKCNTVNQETTSVNESLSINELKQLVATLNETSHVTSGDLPDLDSSVCRCPCPFTQSGNENWAPITSHRKNNKPYVDAPKPNKTGVNDTQKHAVKQNTQKTDNTLLPSTGRVSYTDASGSKPRSNTKNDRIQRPLSRSKKNKVEAQLRKFKSCSNKNNYVSDCNANVKNVVVSNNSENVCLSCNKCLCSANHNACVVKYIKDVEKRLRWKPTGRMFNMEGSLCPIIKTTLATIVPLVTRLHTISIPAVTPNAETRMQYSIAKNSLIRARINSCGHLFNPPNFAFVRNSGILEQSFWNFGFLGIT